jgi:hypothetical protein
MAVNKDIALKALSTMAEQARMAVKFMGVANPSDLSTAMQMVDSTEDLLKTMLNHADS